MRVNLLYDRVTIQGEGWQAGARCTFLRLYACNLHCAWCDTPETWDTRGRNGPAFPVAQNMTRMTVEEIATRVAAMDVDLLVVTGGEPLLQRTDLAKLAAVLHDEAGIAVHVETNGTIAPNGCGRVEHWNVSPKLPSAKAGDLAIDLNVLAHYAALGWQHATFKTVVSTLADLDDTVALYDTVGVERRARYVMPETHDAADLDKLQLLTEPALARGLSVTTRLHVALWGTEKGR